MQIVFASHVAVVSHVVLTSDLYKTSTLSHRALSFNYVYRSDLLSYKIIFRETKPLNPLKLKATHKRAEYRVFQRVNRYTSWFAFVELQLTHCQTDRYQETSTPTTVTFAKYCQNIIRFSPFLISSY